MKKHVFFISAEKLFLFSRHLNFCLDHVEKQLDYKDEANFKIYDVTTWLTNNYNKYIVQYLTK